MPLSDPLEHQGVWFLPEQPERRVVGRLSFEPTEGSVLDLIGSLQADVPSSQDFAPPLILGVSAMKAAPITLVDCVQTNVQWNTSQSGAMITSSLRPTFTLVGAHFEARDALQFDEAYLRFSNLDQWAAMPGFQISFDLDGNSQITYKKPDPFPLLESHALTMSLMAWPRLPGMEMVQTEARISHRVSVQVRATEPGKLERFIEVARQIQQFLTLLVGEPVVPTALDVRTEAHLETAGKKTAKTPIDTLFQVAHGLAAEQRRILPVEMLLSRPALGDDLMSLAKAWFDSQPLLQPVYDLFAGALLNPGMYLDQAFLATTQAVESFHRRTRSEGIDPSHQERISRILRIQSAEDRDWLEKQLQYSHEPSLRKRLRDLLDQCPEIVPYLGDRLQFIQSVVATRNYLTHYDSALKSQALQHQGMWDALQQLRALLTIAILRYLGIPAERTEELLKGNSRPMRYLRLAAERS